MADTKAAWEEVGNDLTSLGLKLKLHFEQAGSDLASASEVQDALRQLAASIEHGFEGVENAVRDEAVRENVGKVAESLANALATSLSEAGHGLSESFSRTKTDH